MKTIELKKNSEIGGFDIIINYVVQPSNNIITQRFNIKKLKRALYLLKRNVKNGYEFIY